MSDWHLDKRLNIGHVISTLIIAATAFSYINSIERKTDANSLQIETIKNQRKEDNTRLEKQRKEDVDRVEKQLSSINAKLDRLLSK